MSGSEFSSGEEKEMIEVDDFAKMLWWRDGGGEYQESPTRILYVYWTSDTTTASDMDTREAGTEKKSTGQPKNSSNLDRRVGKKFRHGHGNCNGEALPFHILDTSITCNLQINLFRQQLVKGEVCTFIGLIVARVSCYVPANIHRIPSRHFKNSQKMWRNFVFLQLFQAAAQRIS